MRFLAALILLLFVAGCESLSYYAQAIGGHLHLISDSRPVDSWLSDPTTSPELRARLSTARGIREFASRSLGLPENASYGSYADVGRPFVVWNVYAAPEFAVEARQECFPFAGCVPYRGFYSEDQARRHAARLRADGYDVHLGGVPAYSTLGWFDDPLLSTFIGYPDAQLARLVFHELAHQLVYRRDDSTFNESFAVVVEDEGVRRWLESKGSAAELVAFRAAQARKREFAATVQETRKRLALIYRENLSPEEKQRRKAEEFSRLRARYGAIVPAEPNNAFLVSVSVYTQLVPAFERLLAESGGYLPRFYGKVRELAASDNPARELALRRNEPLTQN